MFHLDSCLCTGVKIILNIHVTKYQGEGKVFQAEVMVTKTVYFFHINAAMFEKIWLSGHT